MPTRSHKKTTATDDRLPPHSEEAERGVLACCLLDPTACVPELVSRFGQDVAGAFYCVQNQVVAQALVALAEKGSVDVVTLAQRIKDAGDLEMAGGAAYLSALPDAAPSAANMPSYLEILQGKYRLRKLLKVCAEATAQVWTCNGHSEELLDAVERDVMAVRQFGNRSDVRTMKQVVIGAMGRMEKAMECKGGLSGLATGLSDWDRMTGGLQRTELTVIAGKPGGGKTALATNVAAYVAVELGKPVAVFSLEMSAESLTTRMLCSMARVNVKKARTGQFVEDDLPKLAVAASRLAKAEVHWEDVSDLTLPELRAKARRLRQRHGVELIVVDYIQLVNGKSDGRRDESEEQQISGTALACKAVAMELNIPVVALSQINDAGLLRGSRAIGHHADNVCRLVKRKADEREDEWADLGADAVPVDLMVLKQRNGPTGKVPLVFLKCFTRFENAARAENQT